ncbi:hypothetical protein P5G51_018760 [Virgibacillus sp. 179-BFC.A HS]|uniref:Uncharacterized protein n=1 Tax=Tigheibacillus jepli TaxID=3035914 RepID=A0ABU5CL64_9BACI|nr:hypothetical protein [Virgibacillus sp. 179-BFC.A HS]MDY0407104.1 hypothetical protein [Virgibacillus sp. 179-BFC.A HS]
MPKLESLFKNAANIIESLTDNHKTPLHVGETMAAGHILHLSATLSRMNR